MQFSAYGLICNTSEDYNVPTIRFVNNLIGRIASNMIVCLLWLWMLETLVALKMEMSAWSLYHESDESDLQKLFQSLSLERLETRMSLLELLSQEEIPLHSDYAKHKITKYNAELLRMHFIDQPEVHPLIMPFAFYARSQELRSALRGQLQKYRPGIIASSRDNALKWVECRHLDILLEPARKRLEWWGPGALQAAAECKLKDIPWEVSDFPWSKDDQREATRRQGHVLPILRVLHQRGSKGWASLLEQCLSVPQGQEPFIQALVKLTGAATGGPEWRYDFAKVVHMVKEATGGMDRARQALWHAKLVMSVFELFESQQYWHPNSADIMTEFLDEHQIREIPPFLLPQLYQYQISMDMSTEPRLYARLVELDVISPTDPKLCGGLPECIKWWHHNLRSKGCAKVSEPPCDPCSFDQIEQWWGEGMLTNLATSIHLKPQSFPKVKLQRKDGQLIYCSTLKAFLAEISHMYNVGESRLLERRPDGGLYLVRVPECFRKARALARTLTVNLLYRHKLGISLAWPCAIEDIYKGTTPSGLTSRTVRMFLKESRIYDYIALRLLGPSGEVESPP